MTNDNSKPLSEHSAAAWVAGSQFLFSEVLPSDIACVDSIVERVMETLNHNGCREQQCAATELSLREALANAIIHGNGCDPGKRVELDCFRHQDGSITIVVRDEGPGFSLDQLKDPTAPENVYLATGRGIYLIRHFMDDVRFERNGSEIQMHKKQDDSTNSSE